MKHRQTKSSPDRVQRRRRSRRLKVAAVSAVALTMVGGVAYAATSWVVGLNPGSSGQAQSATISNLTITATATPTPVNVLYPGNTGDVVVTITNPNPYPVTVTAVNLPTNTTYAAGYSNSALTTPVAACASSTSLVGWNFATGTTGSSHTLTAPLIVGASGSGSSTLTVTLTNDATMSSSSPAACAGVYFSMPSLTGVTATAGGATATTSPATDAWTS